ncbi:MAG: S8 family serine peptidase [Thiobacillus sp.]|nr:S8 family serine peptidase [Thiobacillus sp.]
MNTVSRALGALSLSLSLLWAAAVVNPASAGQISPATFEQLSNQAEKGEPLKVIVRVAGKSSARGADARERAALRRAITVNQQSLLKRQSGWLKRAKMFREVPYVAVETDRSGLAALVADADVVSIEEDIRVEMTLNETPAIVDADLAWAAGYRGAGQAVAVLDTGVDTSHPFFAGKIAAEACFSTNSSSTTSLCPNGQSSQTGPGAGAACTLSNSGCWHGTHVAGIAVGKTGVIAGAGMAPDARLIPIQVFTRVCGADGVCSVSAYSSDIGLALEHVYQLSATIPIASVNLSLGGGSYTAACDAQAPSIKEIVDVLRGAGIATVAASGNGGSANAINFPACISSTISVGSTTKQNVVASYSNSSAQLSLLAPGSDIYSAVPGGGFSAASGTSMATPHVAGAWALMKSAKPSATVSEALAALSSTGTGITDTRNGLTRPSIRIGGSVGAIAAMIGSGNQPPTISLTSPTNNAGFSAPATVAITANANDADGTVTRVEFYQSNTLIGTDSNGADGWSFNWTQVPAGNYTLTARAFDNGGASTTSAGVAIGVASPGASPTLGLVAHYPFDETSGTVASDASGFNNHASVLNGAAWISGRVNGALMFDGVNDGLNLANLASLGSGNTPHTVASWVRVDSLPSGRAWMLLLGREGTGAHHWLLNATGVAQLGVWSGNQAQPTLPVGVWKHVALSFDGTTLRAYIDGVLIATKPATFNLSGVPLTVATQHVGERFFRGALDDLRIYNRALSASEVAGLVGGNTGNQPPTISLTSPTNNAGFSAPATVAITANANDADGTVTRVEFYQSNTLIGTDSNGADGWSFNWTQVPAGNYTLTARAFDNGGASTTSAGVAIGVASPGASPTLGLVAHYPFDETSGTVASDASGFNNHASVLNGAAWISGRVNGALMFDGVNDGLNLANLASLGSGNTPHTVASWVRVDSLPSGRAWMLLLGREGTGAHHWLLNATGVAQLGVWSGNQAQPTLPVGVWKHVALSFDGTTLRAYIDGVLIATKPATFNLSGVPLTVATQHVGERFFRGALDDLRIYNRALSASEVAGLAKP